jgi:epoxide hydrolase-like predicted phosphatase
VIKAIIFDCFGVLAGSSFKEIYRQAGGDLSRDAAFLDDVLMTANSGLMSSRDMHQQVAKRLGMTYDVWYETLRQGEQPSLELLEYVAELKKTYKTAILSNANHGTMQRKFTPEQLGLFDQVIVSAEVGMLKPNAEIYELAAERLGVEPSECVFTDDSQVYAEAARATGMQAIWYQNLDQFKQELAKLL